MIKKFAFALVFCFATNVWAVEASTEVQESEREAMKLVQGSDELAKPIVPSVAAAEAEIPVQLEPTKKAEGTGSIAWKALFSIFLIGGVGVGAYFLIGKYRRARIGTSAAPQIKILTQHYLGPKKSLAIVRIAGESILIGVTDHNISMIKSLSLLDEEIPDVTPQHFSSLFNENLENQKMKPEENEEFSISGIKDFVSTRLKNMRTLE